jgi:MFS family permease
MTVGSETATPEHDKERLATGYSGRLAVLLATAWLAIQLGRQAIPPLLPVITAELSMTPSAAGVALTVTFALYAATGFVGGRLSDEWSRTTVIAFGLGVLVTAFSSFVLVQSYPGFIATMAAVGIGTGFFYVPTRAFLSDLFVARRGQAFGINEAAGMAGSALAAGVAVAILAVATWRVAVVPTVVLLLGVLCCLLVWSRERIVVGPAALELRSTGARTLLDRRVRLLAVVFTAFSFTVQATFGFLPTFLQADRQLTPLLASGGFATFFIIGMLVMPVAGNVGDRFPSVVVAITALAVATAGLGTALVAPTTALLFVGIVVFAAGLWTFSPVIQAYLMTVFPDANVGGDFGAFRAFYTGVGSLGPAYVGVVAERADYTTAFAGLGVCLLFGIGLLLYLVRSDRE